MALHAQGLATLLPAWTPAELLMVEQPETGTIHQTYLLFTSGGNYALRAYRYSEKEPIEREHALITYAHAHGLPAPEPLPLLSGGTIHTHAGNYYALFPFVPGRQVRRGHISAGEITAMGRFLARLHQALREYPPERVAQRNFCVDREPALRDMQHLEALIQTRPQRDAHDDLLLKRLTSKRTWLENTTLTDPSQLARLEFQVIHGDYQETNLFFDKDEVCAIIDWDQSYSAPRAWEIVRALHYVCGFQPTESQLFLDAYRSVLPLTWEELDLAGQCYAVVRSLDLWLYKEIYINNNPRPRRFVQKEMFVPVTEKWAQLLVALTSA